MPLRLIPSFLFFCFIQSITPGPANLCSLSASIRYGKKLALRQWRGIFIGFAIVSLTSVCLSYFIGGALGDYVGWLKYVGAAYLVWLAYHIFRSEETEDEEQQSRSCNFMTGLIVQLTNVKIMVYCITALGSYVLPYTTSFGALLAVGLFLPFTGPVCNLVWLFAGVQLREIFRTHRKLLNTIMAISLVGCAVSLVLT